MVFGEGVFESARDRILIDRLADECGLRSLEKKARDKAKAEHDTARKGNDVKQKADDHQEGAVDGAEDSSDPLPIIYSMHSQGCTHPRVIRDFLDNGALSETIKKHEDDDDQGYTLLMIGVCAMDLGCTLTEDFLDTLRRLLPDCSLLGDKAREEQIRKALFGPDGFENGKQYDFQGKSQLSMMAATCELEDQPDWSVG